MAFYLTEEQVELLRAVDRTSPTGYADIYDLIHFFVQSADPLGNAADDNVIAWFGAAKDANRGVGGASEFIRSYTAFQLEMRNGAPIAGIDSLVQNASNAIAQSVYDDILDADVIKDGVKYYELPTAKEIGAQDAAATVDALANYPGGVANWSGNPLFIGLGIADFWSDNILADNDDTYDLALSVGAMFHALQASSGTGLLGLIGLFYTQGVIDATWSGLSTASSAVGATYSYLWQSYGDTNLGVGDLVAGGLLVGSASNETMTAANFTETSGWLHAGGGADIIYAASDVSEQADRAGVFDGGEGIDLMSFLYATTPDDGGVTVQITEWSSGVPFSALVNMPYGGQAFLFNIERLNLSDADDRLVIDSLTTTLEQVNALDSQDQGDTLDASDLGSAFSLDLTTGAFTVGGASLQLLNFENTIGSSGADTITGSDEANIVLGGSGVDQLFGGGADDFIFFDAEDTAVNGGAGRDVAVALGDASVTVDMAAQGLECVIGCDGADTITVGDDDGNLMVAGGGGADTIIVSYGDGQDTRILWGGDDSAADEFMFVNTGMPGAQLGLLVVTVAGLTTENFSTFDLSMLNLPATFSWGAIDAVIINSESQDQFYGLSDTMPIFTELFGIQSIDETVSGSEWDVVWSGYMEQAVQGSSSYLGATLHMQVPEYGSFTDIWYREKGDSATAWLNGSEYYDQGITDLIADLTDEYGDPVVDWSINMSEFDEHGDGTGMLWINDAEWNGGPDSYDQWFVAGGAIYDTQIVANGAPHAIMPEDTGPSPFDWLLAA
jgi:hypothetical protein